MMIAFGVLGVFLAGLVCGLLLRKQSVVWISPCANYVARDCDGMLVHDIGHAGDPPPGCRKKVK